MCPHCRDHRQRIGPWHPHATGGKGPLAGFLVVSPFLMQIKADCLKTSVDGTAKWRIAVSKMRMSILSALAAIAFGIFGASSVSAAPANGGVITHLAATSAIQKVRYYRRYGYYRPYNRYRYYRPYYCRPYYYRPYYYGYYRPYYYYRTYYRPYYYRYYR